MTSNDRSDSPCGGRHGSEQADRARELVATGRVRFVAVDLADPAAPQALVEEAGERIDVLVDNVGVAVRGSTASSRSTTTHDA